MADWGPVTNHEQVGIEPYILGDPNSGVVTVGVRFYVSSVAWGFNDPQTLSVGGTPFGGAYGYTLSTPSGTTQALLVAEQQWNVATRYGGGDHYTFSASVSGHYLGAGPSHAIGFDVPARSAYVPTPPAATVDSVTASSARVFVPPVTNDGGAGVDTYTAAIWRQSDGGVVEQKYGGTATFTGLTRATGYYGAAAAHNAIGWSAWSGSQYFTTKPLAPGAPTITGVANVTSTTATVFVVAAADNGGAAVTSRLYQVAPVSDFSSGVQTATGGALSGLPSGAHLYVRVRDSNSVGPSPWSNTAQFDTLSGVKVKVAGTWRSAKLYVKVAGVWRPVAKLFKKHGGSWSV